MKNYQLIYLKHKLTEELRKTEDILESGKNLGFEGYAKNNIQELSMYDNHPADLGSELFEQEKNLSLSNHQNQRISDIKEALDRINNNTYGLCDFCGKEIGFERLEAYPTAKLCIKCQKETQLNTKKLEHDRPIEEEVLKMPFGRTFTDGRDNVAYDGEDTWQDVEQYGTSSESQLLDS